MNTREAKHFESLYPAESRAGEIAEIVHFIREGNSTQIVSLPGVGRSNLLGLLAHNRSVRQKHFPTKNLFVHFVTVNFSELHTRPLIDVTKLMFLNLLDSLRERELLEEYAVVNEIFREVLPLQDEFVLFQGLKRVVEYIGVEKKLTLIFLFDRFEEYVPMLSHGFFSNLRILRNLAKYRFSVIFTLYKPLEDILEAELLADFYEFVAGHVVYLSLYDEPSVTFRLSYLEQLTGKKLDQAEKAELLHLTGGHWKLTKLGAEAILASSDSVIPGGNDLSGISHIKRTGDAGPSIGGQARQDDEKIDIHSSLKNFLISQKTIQGALYEIMEALTPVEQKALLVILGSGATPESVGDDNGERFRANQNDGVEIQDDPTAKHFQNIGLISEGKVAIPLLAAYLESEAATLQTKGEQIVFDEEKNVIRKGEKVLSDTLTAAEFRLLAHMLHNPDSVIERNELIDVVWQGAKSTAGVTDQAVDQLIFRIRRKIEDNPNHPKHLITVKGRGFEFRA